MFKNSYKLLFLTTLIIGTSIAISSNSWLSAWMGLEINLLSFIPLVNDTKNLMSSESSLKYFLVQALASTTLLFLLIIYLMIYNNNNESIFMNQMINLGMMSSLMLKMGMAPFHFWFPSIMEGLNWINSFILLTWQKIAPMMLISYLNLEYLFIPIICSMIIGAIGGLNQTSLRKIMAYSSINHIGWMMTALMHSCNMWLNYFIIYTFLSMTLIYFFFMNKLYFLIQMYSFYNFSNELKMIFFLNFLSLGGLPPFLGFFPKWLVIQSLIEINQFYMMTLMVLITLMTLFYYIRMCYASFMMNYYENKWNLKWNMKMNYSIYLILSFFSIFGLILINIMFFIM